MNCDQRLKPSAAAIALALLIFPWQAIADDTDIFIGTTATSGVPNVLFVIDNSSNWATASQAWPSGKQGAAELLSASKAVKALKDSGKKLNVGVMLGTPSGGASGSEQFGAYVAHHVQDPTVVSGDGMNFYDRLSYIATNVGNNGPFNSASSGSWSPLLADAYQYFKGMNAFQTNKSANFTVNVSGQTVVITDSKAYVNDPTVTAPTVKYVSPVGTDDQCGNNYVIFIGNKFPNVSATTKPEAPAADTLVSDGGTKTPIIPLQEFGTLYSGTKNWTTTCSTSQPATPPALSCPANYVSTFTGNQQKGTCNGSNRQYEYACAKTDWLATYSDPGSNNEWADEWTRFMLSSDVVSGSTDSSQGIQNITTYTIDVYNATRDWDQSRLLKSMADVGGGKYFSVNDENKLQTAIGQILNEIAAKSSSFAAASLPISAANRTQNNNQVFIGMFRPDQKGMPRWFGNLKQFQLVLSNGQVVLGDRNGLPAVSSTTGFVTDCAISEWASDSPYPTAASGTNSGYWFGFGIDPPPETSCTTVMATKGSSTTTAIGTAVGQINPFSDLPDGPFVEKGGTAEVIRRNNDGGATSTWRLNRNMFAMVGGTFGTFGSSSDTLKEWTRGRDVNDENKDSLGPISTSTDPNNNQTRPSLHGDVIHSRPLAVNYNTKSGTTVTTDKPTVVYYGANDGTFRAIDAATGIERWSFVDYDAFNDTSTLSPSKLQRLMDNTLPVSYPNFWPSGTVTRNRDYFFDGSIGQYQNADNSKVWIYPVQRRGGSMIYAFNVSKDKLGTTSDTPTMPWRFGCRSPGDTTNCAGDATASKEMGQTWATPIAVPMAAGAYSNPVVVVGGGYDTCEDTDTATPASACGTASLGRTVVVLDAFTGALVRDFHIMDGSVAGDVSVIAVGNNKTADFAYAADTRGNIYRIDFGTYNASTATTTPLTPDKWKIGKIATTTANGKKFLFGPALLWNGSNVYVAIGTGDREHPLKSEQATNIQNRFYVFLDDITKAADTITSPLNLDTDSQMQDYSYTSNFTPTCDTTKLLPGAGTKGWFMSLAAGEQVVTSAVIFGGAVTFSTNLPTTANACTNTLGEARGYWVNLLNASSAIGVVQNCNGTNPPYSTFKGGGLPPSPVIANVDLGDGYGARTIMIGAGNKQGGKDTSSPIGAQEVKVPISSTRRPLYWFNKAD